MYIKYLTHLKTQTSVMFGIFNSGTSQRRLFSNCLLRLKKVIRTGCGRRVWNDIRNGG